MLTLQEIEALFRDMESDRVERKRSLADPDRILQAICAYANDLPNHREPGVIFVGQNDDGSCTNLVIDDELLLVLGGMRNNGKILPFPVMSVQRHTINGCIVAAVIVAPSEQPPVRLDARCWIRVGPRRALATVEEERRLSEKQIWRNRPFDARPCGSARISDLNADRFEEEYVPSAVAAETRRVDTRSSIEKLKALRMVTPNDAPTNASVLLFAHDTREHFPGAYIQFVRFDGEEITDNISDQKEISGTIMDQIAQLDSLIRINIRTITTVGGALRQEFSDYPFVSLQQIARNAILHRSYDESTMPVKVHWYSNRVEIINPGGLYGEVDPENIFLSITSYRNALLAEGMKHLGAVERFGVGLAIARRALQNNGNPDLAFDFKPNFTMFLLRARP